MPAARRTARPEEVRCSLRNFLLERLVLCDRHAVAFAGRRLRAVRAKQAGPAYFGVEVHGLAGLERLHFARRTRDGASAQVDVEIALGDQARLSARCPHGFENTEPPRLITAATIGLFT